MTRKDVYKPDEYKQLIRSYDYGGSRRKRIDKIFQDYPHLDENKLIDYLLKLYFYKLAQLGMLPSFFVDADPAEILEFEMEFGAKFPLDQQHTLYIYDDLEVVHEVITQNQLDDSEITFGLITEICDILHNKGRPMDRARVYKALSELKGID